VSPPSLLPPLLRRLLGRETGLAHPPALCAPAPEYEG
jgi:hypothetical protein